MAKVENDLDIYIK